MIIISFAAAVHDAAVVSVSSYTVIIVVAIVKQ
jgi:hypothetical protein